MGENAQIQPGWNVLANFLNWNPKKPAIKYGKAGWGGRVDPPHHSTMQGIITCKENFDPRKYGNTRWRGLDPLTRPTPPPTHGGSAFPCSPVVWAAGQKKVLDPPGGGRGFSSFLQPTKIIWKKQQQKTPYLQRCVGNPISKLWFENFWYSPMCTACKLWILWTKRPLPNSKKYYLQIWPSAWGKKMCGISISISDIVDLLIKSKKKKAWNKFSQENISPGKMTMWRTKKYFFGKNVTNVCQNVKLEKMQDNEQIWKIRGKTCFFLAVSGAQHQKKEIAILVFGFRWSRTEGCVGSPFLTKNEEDHARNSRKLG